MMRISVCKTISGLAAMLLLILLAPVQAAEHPDKLYRAGQYAAAAKGYDQLDLDHPKDARYRYNRGCASYQLKDYARAEAAFSSAYRRATTGEQRFKAMYNLGNTAFQAGKLNEALDAYKQAIRLNPASTAARYNLELTLRKIKENADKQKQNQQKKQDQQQQGDGQQGQNNQQGQDKQQSGQKDKGQGKDQPDKDQSGKQQQQGQNQTDKQQSGSRPQPSKGQSGPKDLSGELKSANANQAPAQQTQAGVQQQQMRALERAKAEALIDNTSEDRSQYMQMQVPQDRRAGAPSGKYW